MPFASCTYVALQRDAAIAASKAYVDSLDTNTDWLAKVGPAIAPYVCPSCTSTPTPTCSLTLGGAINDNSGNRIGATVNCPVADRATYIGQGFVVVNDNAGNFLTMARLTAGTDTACSMTFSVALRDNANNVIGYIPA